MSVHNGTICILTHFLFGRKTACVCTSVKNSICYSATGSSIVATYRRVARLCTKFLQKHKTPIRFFFFRALRRLYCFPVLIKLSYGRPNSELWSYYVVTYSLHEKCHLSSNVLHVITLYRHIRHFF